MKFINKDNMLKDNSEKKELAQPLMSETEHKLWTQNEYKLVLLY